MRNPPLPSAAPAPRPDWAALPDSLPEALQYCSGLVADLLATALPWDGLAPPLLREAARSYVERGGKRLRPALVLWSCGAVGGDPGEALAAAGAVELFHNWSLIHDDVIDQDDLRRGGPTAHVYGARVAREEMGYGPAAAERLGRDIAILAGDVLHGWAARLLAQTGAPTEVALHLTERLAGQLTTDLLRGEAEDVLLAGRPLTAIALPEILAMLWAKTGALYEFCARAGALIGLRTVDEDHAWVHALATFAGHCGVAFQLQDEVLGAVGDQAALGKPVGSDLREGKRTVVVFHALERATPAQRALVGELLGRPHLSADEVAALQDVLQQTGAIAATQALARDYVARAKPQLEALPASTYRSLLAQWADRMVERQT